MGEYCPKAGPGSDEGTRSSVCSPCPRIGAQCPEARSSVADTTAFRDPKPDVRVLWLITSLGPGGAERRLVETAPLLQERGAHVVVGVLVPGGGLEAELTAKGIAPVSLAAPARRPSRTAYVQRHPSTVVPPPRP